MDSVKLVDICRIEKGQQIDTSRLNDSHRYRYINGGVKESGYYDSFNSNEECVLVSEGGASCGYVNYINEPFWCGCHCYRLFDLKVMPKYLYYALKANQERIMDLRTGVCMPNIKKKDFQNFVVSIDRDAKRQNAVVKALDTIQKAIDLKRKQLEDLDELVKSKFQEMFGDVDGYKCLRDYSSLITKGASPRWQGLTYQESGVLFITSENVREGYLDISKAKYLDDGINKLLPRSILQKGDILINIVGASIGRAAIFDIDQLANINQAVAVVRPIENGIDNHFLIEYLNSQRAMDLYDSMKQGGARDNLSLKNIADLLIPDVCVSKQKEFSGLVRKRNELKEIVIKEIADLEELMDSKMDEYFG